MRPRLPGGTDIRQAIAQQNAPQFFPAATEHLHRHGPLTADTVSVFPFQQAAIVAAVRIAGNRRDSYRAAQFDIG